MSLSGFVPSSPPRRGAATGSDARGYGEEEAEVIPPPFVACLVDSYCLVEEAYDERDGRDSPMPDSRPESREVFFAVFPIAGKARTQDEKREQGSKNGEIT
jgi:hypothetical protein